VARIDHHLAVVRAPPGMHQLGLPARHQHDRAALLQRAREGAPRHLRARRRPWLRPA